MDLPNTLPGHWETDEGSGMAKHYLAYHPTRATLHAGHLSDFMVANQIAMTGRGDLAFEGKLATAKDRIRWLSAQLALANQRSRLEIGVRNIVYNLEQAPETRRVLEIVASLRILLDLKPGERP